MRAAERLILLAPGAGAPSSSSFMQRMAECLAALGHVECFDYPYQVAGRRTPDRQPVLVAAHRAALERAREGRRGRVLLAGKSMGGRIGCHLAVALDEKPDALVCLGYPLVGQNGSVRDAVLLELRTPILFVQGSRDPMCPLDRLAAVRARMAAPSELFTVEGGDHSLAVTKRALAARGETEDELESRVLTAIASFADRYA